MLTGINLSFAREEKKLFSGLKFSLEPGALLFITGPNGSGKTTLLKLMAGLLAPTMGQVSWQDAPVTHNEEYAQTCLYIGHQNAIKNELTVLENIRFWAELRGEPILIPAALNYFELEEVAEMPCRLLSAGWQRRVALANLITTPRRMWLLDEPATHLDIKAAALLDGLISTRCKQGGIVATTTHSTNLPPAAFTLNVSAYA